MGRQVSCRFFIDNNCEILDLSENERGKYCAKCTFYQTEEEHRLKEQYVKRYYESGGNNG